MNSSHPPSPMTRHNSIEMTAEITTPPSTPETEAPQPFFGRTVSTETVSASGSVESSAQGKGGRRYDDKPSVDPLRGVFKSGIGTRKTMKTTTRHKMGEHGGQARFAKTLLDALAVAKRFDLSGLEEALDAPRAMIISGVGEGIDDVPFQ